MEDSGLVINGKSGIFERQYTGKDREIFNVGREYDDYETYHHETATLDFHNYPAGTSGCIMFAFNAVFPDENGMVQGLSSVIGSGQMLYFYAGEDGIGISNTSAEDAEKAYQEKGEREVTPPDAYTGRWHGKNISKGLYDALKTKDTDAIPVSVTLSDRTDGKFVYKGRTLNDVV